MISGSDYVNIHFYHALAAVKFDITNLGSGIAIKSISIKGVKAAGNCVVTGSAAGCEFEWTPSGTAKKFVQSFNSDDFETVDGRITQKIYEDKVFFMIPQTLEDDAYIEMTLQNGLEPEYTVKASIAGDIWDAGKYYTYSYVPGGVSLILTTPAEMDAHYGNAILRFSKTTPQTAQVKITNPDETTTTINPMTAGSATAAAWIRFAAPAGNMVFSTYPGYSNTVDIVGLFSELVGSGTKTHFYEDDNFYYTQAFVDEYVLGGSPDSYVGKPDRKFSITISKDDTIDSSDPVVVISQKSMQSPYNLTTASNPFGVEVVEEGAVTGTDPVEWCKSRNRDENGNGVIDASEIKWRVPSLKEYLMIWYGTHSMPTDYWLGNSSSPAPEQYLTSDGKAYNGLLGTTSLPSSGDATVRCIRYLGSSAADPMYTVEVESGDLSNGEAPQMYIVTVSNVSEESMRSKVTGRELSGVISPGEGTDASDNKLYQKFQVASKYLSWPVSDGSAATTIPVLEYNLKVESDRTIAAPVFEYDVTKSGSSYTIQGAVKMINPDPRLSYISSFVGLRGAVTPDEEWSYLDNDGVLHFYAHYNNWTASNSESGWKLEARIQNADGTVTDIDSNVCTLYYVKSGKSSDVSGVWGSSYKNNGAKIDGMMLDDSYLKVGSSEYFRLVVVDGGPYTATNVVLPVTSEYFEGMGDEDNMKYLDYLCRSYYYEDVRYTNGDFVKADLGTWRAPNQRELSIMISERNSLPVTRMQESGSSYSWSTYSWQNDQVATFSITNGTSPYYNLGGDLSANGTAPYKVRCVRDID